MNQKKSIILIIFYCFCLLTMNLFIQPTKGDDSTDWPMLFNTPQKTGFTPSQAPDTNQTLWIENIHPSSQPIISGNKVFIAGGSLNIYVYDSTTGNGIGSFLPPITNPSSVAVSSEKILVAGFIDTIWSLCCYSTTNYTLLWNYPLGNTQSYYAPVLVSDSVFYAYENDEGTTNITGLNIQTGSLLWQNIQLEARLTSDIVVDDHIYCTLSQTLFCFSSTTGEQLWSKQILDGTDSFDNNMIPVLHESRLYTISKNGIVFCLDLNTQGNILWQYTTGDSGQFLGQNHPAIGYGNIYIPSTTRLFCINLLNPENPQWTYASTNQKTPRNPVVADNKIFFGVRQLGLFCLNSQNGIQIWFSSLLNVDHLSIAQKMLFVTNANDLYVFYHNQKPQSPVLTGPSVGIQNKEQIFTLTTTDPNGDDVFYRVYWDDGTGYTEYGPYDSGEIFEITHTYAQKGSYLITIAVGDPYQAYGLPSYHQIQIVEQPPIQPNEPLPLIIYMPSIVLEEHDFTILITTTNDIPVQDITVVFNTLEKQTNRLGQILFQAPAVEIDTPFTITAYHSDYITTTTTFQVKNQQQKPQIIYGYIYGEVTDSSGIALPQVEVSILSETEKRIISTDADGRYVLSLTPSLYTVVLSKTGYEKITFTNVLVQENLAVERSISLQKKSTETQPALTPSLIEYIINQQQEKGSIGARMTIAVQTEPLIDYYIPSIMIDDIQINSETISFFINGVPGTASTTTVLHIDSGVLANVESLTVSYDGVEITKQTDVTNFFEDALGDTPQWYQATYDGEAYVFISTPSFSSHSVIISSTTQSGAVLLYIIFAVIIGLITAIPAFRLWK